MLLRVVLEEAGAHHRRQRERNHRRHGDRDAERDGELAEKPPDDAAHEEDRE